MKKLCLILMMLFCISGTALAAPQSEATEEFGRIAVVPYLDTTEQEKQREYIPEVMNELYTNYFASNGFTVMSAENTEKALAKAGYDPSNQMLPDKDVMAEVARALGADYVVALELADLDAARHTAYFSTKVSTSVKLKYHFYNAKTGKMTPFQTTGSNNNKAVLVGVRSYKSSISASLAEALEKGNEKIQSFL